MSGAETANLRIGDVARLVGTTPRTIRYYEEIGLLAEGPARLSGKHRIYTQPEVERLREVMRLKDLLGVSLEELKTLLTAEEARAEVRAQLRRDDVHPGRRRELLIEALGHIDRQLELVRHRAVELAKLEDELGETRKRVRRKIRELDARAEGAFPHCKEVVVERKWWTLIAVSVAIFMLLLDITVVNVALPDIQRSLHSSFSDLQWVVNAYALTLAAFLLTSGSVSDLIGRKRVFIAGLFVFTISSAVCGLSTTPLMLNLARAVQGTGGAMMFSTALALIAEAFHGRERGTAFGVFGAVTGAAVAVGPVLGGIITSGIGWEWIFFVNIPIGVVAVFITLTKVQDSRDPNATGVDWPGLLTFSGSLFLLVYALVQGNQKGWGSTEIVAFLLAAAVLLVAFVTVERLQSRPMLDLSLFRRPAFTGASIVAFTLSGSFFAMFLYLTLYIQDVLGYSPVQAGLRFLPTTLLSFAVAPVAGRLSVRVPVRLLLGSGLALIGLGLIAMTTIDASSHWTVLIPGFLLAGAGVGLVNPPLASTAIGVVPHERSGMASGINSTFRQVGIATGIAGLGAVFQHSVTRGTTATLRASGHAHEVLAAAHGQLGTLLESGEVTQIAHSLNPAARTALEHSYRVGFTGAFTTIALIAAVLALVGAFLAFVLVRSRDFVATGDRPVSQEAPEPIEIAVA